VDDCDGDSAINRTFTNTKIFCVTQERHTPRPRRSGSPYILNSIGRLRAIQSGQGEEGFLVRRLRCMTPKRMIMSIMN